jgi:hypothetical protein
MVIQKLHEPLVLQGTHMCDVYRQLWESPQQLLEVLEPNELVAHRPGAHMQKHALIASLNHFIERDEPFIVRIKALHEELQLKAYNVRVLDEFVCHLKGIGIVGMVGGETVKVRDFIEDLEVPGINALSNTYLVSIIGVDDCTNALLPEIVHALPVIEVMEHTPPIAFLEELPDRFKESVREEVNMKVDDLIRRFHHMFGFIKL